MKAKTRSSRVTRVVKALAKALAIVFGLLAILVGLYFWSQSEWVIDARRSGIQAEIANLKAGHPWAGTYYRGDGLGCNELLSAAPGAGFQYTLHGCLGLYEHDHGSVEQVESRLRLRSRFLSLPSWAFGEYTIVDWGSRRYLVEPKQLIDFVNSVNQHTPMEWYPGLLDDRRYYLRVGDEEKELKGKPHLPPAFATLLLPTRIDGHVTAVSGTRVDLDLGLDRGVFEGMELLLHGLGGNGYGAAVVKEIAAHSSVAEVNYLDSFSPPVTVGWSAESRTGD